MRIKVAPSDAQPYPRYAACDSIKNYGAVGNGTADDAVALQRAINSVGSGCSIFFPPGVYKLSTDVVVNKDITLQLGPQVEIRQYARLKADTNASRSLTIQGEGPGTSLWRTAIDYPFWNGVSGGPKFRNLRMYGVEFRPYSGTTNHHHQYGGATDLLEMVSVTISKGGASSFRNFGFRTGDGTQTYPSLIVLRDVNVFDVRVFMEVSEADLDITRLFVNSPDLTGIRFLSGSTSRRLSISSSRLNFGFASGGSVVPAIELISFGTGKISAAINDVEIISQSWHAALSAEAQDGSASEISLLVNSLRFTTTFNQTVGYAVRASDSASGIVRVVLSGCFFRTTVNRTDAAIQGTLTNASSLRTIAGVDQRGWASLT
jgi:hypothetical protein